MDRLTVALDAGRRARVSTTIASGLVHALAGPSGSGKTTLLRGIAQLVEPVGGTVHVDGESPEVVGYPSFRRRVVYVDQRPAMMPGTVATNLAAPFAYKSARGTFDRKDARGRLVRLGLPAGILERDASKLSVGEQQRVAFVRAASVRPDVYLLDEPTSALDPDAAEALEAMLREDLDRRGAAALLVTHQSAQSERLASKVVALEALDGPS